jgi:pimeloyl-ACP methyl ester carboxylesterase
VVDSGWGDSSAGWGWVQTEVAKSTRICTYDRAGMGWSEVSPKPRTAREFAKELHTLLANANEPSPFVWWAIRWLGIPCACTLMTIQRKSPG